MNVKTLVNVGVGSSTVYIYFIFSSSLPRTPYTFHLVAVMLDLLQTMQASYDFDASSSNEVVVTLSAQKGIG